MGRHKNKSSEVIAIKRDKVPQSTPEQEKAMIDKFLKQKKDK